jgi:hypothetical protein
MKRYLSKKILLGLMTVLFLSSGTLYAEDYVSMIDAEYLKKEFSFQDEVKMKYTGCSKVSYTTCEYVWGKETTKSLKKDAYAKNHNLTPSGNKLMVTYAQAGKVSDFERIKKVQKDAIKIEGIGVDAFWKDSKFQKQLSFITDKNIIIHVSIDVKGVKDAKQHAMAVAQHILDRLNK